jgi:fructokinase
VSAAPYRIGLDLGGTKIEGVVLDPGGAILVRERIPTGAADGYEAILDRLCGLYHRLAAGLGGARHTLGIGTPGTQAGGGGLLRNANTVVLNGRPLAADLERRLARGFRMENDANCFALAEAGLGAARGYRRVFGVIMGTGCGGGIVLDGAVHTGRNGLGGEWGHMSIDPQGAPCFCGARGCVETLISGSGLERRYAEGAGERLPAEAVVARWRAGEPRATALMEGFFVGFGQALANLVHVLDPDAIVLGGGLSALPELYTRGVAEVRARILGRIFETPILAPELGDSAGVIGAALLGSGPGPEPDTASGQEA